jgi:hypothetical protein
MLMVDTGVVFARKNPRISEILLRRRWAVARTRCGDSLIKFLG